MTTLRVGALIVAALTLGAGRGPEPAYRLYVLSESSDDVSVLRFDPGGGLRLDHALKIGLMPARVDGPHGVAVSPDGAHYFVSTAHGLPSGSLWKYSTAGDTLLGRVSLGNYSATVDISPNGVFAFVANFNFHGGMIPSSISVVSTADMTEIARIETCVMPHGSRFNSDGTRHYSVCMMDDLLIEIDAERFGITRRLKLGSGMRHDTATAAAAHHDSATGTNTCSPTWAQPSPDDRHIYVACNKANEILVIDVAQWAIGRRLKTGEGIYNLAVTSDGRRLIGTNKRGRSVSVFDIAAGTELARIATKRGVVHGVALSSDDRYAFVTEEGVGAEPGTVEAIDLRTLKPAASLDVGPQASGVAVLRRQ